MMKSIFLIIFSGVLILSSFSLISAQVNNQYQENMQEPAASNPPRLVEILELSKEQINRLREINRQFQPPLRQARQRMRAANQALDDVVYGGQASEAVIQARLKEAQSAHSAFLKARTDSESAITKILNPGQLTQFRQLRRQNAQANSRNNQIRNQTQPVPNRLNNLQRRIRNRRLQRRNNF